MAAVGHALGVCEESAKSDDDTASVASEVPGYEGFSRKELSEVVLCKMPDNTKEKKTVQWCIDNSYEEIKPGLWGSVVPKELPEAMKRYLQSVHAETSDTDGEDGMPIHPQDDRVAAWEALEALRYCKHILSSSRNQDQPWQHPQELLDASAGALDEAALALRTGDGSPDDLEEVKILSDEIKGSRRALLQAAADGVEESIDKGEKGEKNSTPLVVYATHTGTAKKFAKKLQKALGGDVDVANMKDLTIASVAERRRVFFICSTFGLGRPPRDAEVFFASLQLQEAPGRARTPLAGVDVAVAALGNSGFGDFAAFGRVLAQELRLLGASHLMKVTTLDAKNGVSSQTKEFRAWQGKVVQLESQNLTKNTKQPTSKVEEKACCVIQ